MPDKQQQGEQRAGRPLTLGGPSVVVLVGSAAAAAAAASAALPQDEAGHV